VLRFFVVISLLAAGYFAMLTMASIPVSAIARIHNPGMSTSLIHRDGGCNSAPVPC
jgi:hypothetical protein